MKQNSYDKIKKAELKNKNLIKKTKTNLEKDKLSLNTNALKNKAKEETLMKKLEYAKLKKEIQKKHIIQKNEIKLRDESYKISLKNLKRKNKDIRNIDKVNSEKERLLILDLRKEEKKLALLLKEDKRELRLSLIEKKKRLKKDLAETEKKTLASRAKLKENAIKQRLDFLKEKQELKRDLNKLKLELADELNLFKEKQRIQIENDKKILLEKKISQRNKYATLKKEKLQIKLQAEKQALENRKEFLTKEAEANDISKRLQMELDNERNIFIEEIQDFKDKKDSELNENILKLEGEQSVILFEEQTQEYLLEHHKQIKQDAIDNIKKEFNNHLIKVANFHNFVKNGEKLLERVNAGLTPKESKRFSKNLYYFNLHKQYIELVQNNEAVSFMSLLKDAHIISDEFLEEELIEEKAKSIYMAILQEIIVSIGGYYIVPKKIENGLSFIIKNELIGNEVIFDLERIIPKKILDSLAKIMYYKFKHGVSIKVMDGLILKPEKHEIQAITNLNFRRL